MEISKIVESVITYSGRCTLEDLAREFKKQ